MLKLRHLFFSAIGLYCQDLQLRGSKAIIIVMFLMWKHDCHLQASNNATRILVEMQRAYGDLILFVNHEDSDDDDADEAEVSADSLPKEQDALKYEDLPSFQNRLSHHHVFVNGSGNFYIGVYNADQCVEEDATFNLTITIATPDDPLSLCPLNCSYPQGQCVSDNTCSCEPGYGGMYCAGCECQNTF